MIVSQKCGFLELLPIVAQNGRPLVEHPDVASHNVTRENISVRPFLRLIVPRSRGAQHTLPAGDTVLRTEDILFR